MTTSPLDKPSYFFFQESASEVSYAGVRISTQIQLSCKKKCGTIKIAYRWWPRNGCDDRSATKNSIKVNLCRNQYKSHLLLNFFVIDLPSQPFLGRHLYFTTFSTPAILHRVTPFFTALLFLSRYQLSCFSLLQEKKKCKQMWR